MATTRPRRLFCFPDPVNELAARTVAGGVVLLAALALALRSPWPLVVLAYGFWARVLTGPTLSPLGQLAVRVVAPGLERRGATARLVPGPPKRFAQGMGVAFSSGAVVAWFGFGSHPAAFVLAAMLLGAAFLESAFAYCLGCKVFALLMRLGVIPESVCAACARLDLRHPELARPSAR